MVELLKYLAKEWSVVSHAPFIFLILAVLIFVFAFFLASWRYTSIIDQVKASNENLQQQVSFLNQKCSDLSESSPDILLHRYEKRLKLLEQELVQVEEEKEPLEGQINELKSKLMQSEKAQTDQLKKLISQLESAIKYSAYLEAQKLQLQQHIKEVEEPYMRFLYYANAEVSPGRQKIIRNIVGYLDTHAVLKMSPADLINAFSRITDEVRATGWHHSTGTNGGALTGLNSVGIIDDNDKLTLVGVSVFKSIAREMNANN